MAVMLIDRDVEKRELGTLLVSLREGLSAARVLRGEAGIGKTALLEYVVASAPDMHVSRVAGTESEIDLGFAALHQLLAPFLPRLERLPAPQRAALGSAFGLIEGPAPSLFLVGLATLTLLADEAAQRPLLCVIDDAQWLDQGSAHVLGFVARRLFADRIGMLFALRDPIDGDAAFAGLSELRVGGLIDDDARKLLDAVTAGRLDHQTAARIIAASQGNPLALMELGEELLAGGVSRGAAQLAGPLPLGPRLEARFLSRVKTLPQDTQTLLLLAAAEQYGDSTVLWRAAEHLGVGPEAADLPELDHLIAFEPAVAFRHTLVRSAVYHGASGPARRRAHEALAVALDPERDPDRRAWHLAAATVAPDEHVAAQLERAADRARRRGGWASGAAFLARAAELTPDLHRRAVRELAAAETKLVAGDPNGAHGLLQEAAPRLDDPLSRAQARRLEGEIQLATLSFGESPAILVDAARAFAPLDTGMARETLLEALEAAHYAGRFARGAGFQEVLNAAPSIPLSADSPATVADLLLDGYAAHLTSRCPEAALLFRRAIGRLHRDDDLRWFALACHAAIELLDYEAWASLARRWVKLARDQGALTSLALALLFLSSAEVRAGRFGSAEAVLGEAVEISTATGNAGMASVAQTVELGVMAWRAGEATLTGAAQVAERTSVDRALTVLEIGVGNYEAALTLARAIYDDDPIGMGTSILPDLVEAGVRSGDRQTATAALDRLVNRASAGGAAWGLGLLARSRALLSQDAGAEELYNESIDRLGQGDTALDLARTHLLYGEWLRRQRRRRDARDHLRIAHGVFDSIGAAAFARRAQTELLATGEHVRKRSVPISNELTSHEQRIARLASQGASNQEIAAQLFISPTTVDYHLRKVYRKLLVSNRVHLAHALREAGV